jgi:hypothetical protein
VLCGASRRPLAPGWWLVSVPPGVIVARPGAIAASSCCLLTIAGKEKGGPHAAEERVEWNRKKRGKRYYIGAPPIKLYNNNTSCPVELLYLRYLAAIYTGAAAVAPVPFFFVGVLCECRRLRRFSFRSDNILQLLLRVVRSLIFFHLQSKDKKK